MLSQFERKRKAKGERAADMPGADEDLDALSDHDADEVDAEAADEADEGREAADDELLDQLDDDYPELVLSREEIKAGQVALDKVSHVPLSCAL